jgi:hypothetical protein
MKVLLEIKGDASATRQRLEDLTTGFIRHVDEDKALAADIKQLELGAARSRGFTKAVVAVGAAGGALVGYFIEFVGLRHH